MDATSMGMGTGVDVDNLREWIDGWLGRLAGERQGRQEERRRAFVDGAIDALLGMRRQFCQDSADEGEALPDRTSDGRGRGRARGWDGARGRRVSAG